MRRLVLCEGPADIAALREIGISLFGAKVVPSTLTSVSPAGETRKLVLTVQGNDVEITAVERAKSGLPRALATKLHGLPVESSSDDPNALERIMVLFDPDDEPADKMYARLASEVSAGAKAWKLDGGPGDWVARRSVQAVIVRAVPWRSPGSVVNGLPSWQNLERLLCHVTAVAYPTEAKIVERWLGEISESGKKPSWKAALHLWCALVEPKADEINAPARFLHQDNTCQPHAREAIEQVSLFKDLSLALGFSQT